MTTVILRAALEIEDLSQLQAEFPRVDFVISDPKKNAKIKPALLAKAEVLMSASLDSNELAAAPRLRWVHVPIPSTEHITSLAVSEKSNLLVTSTLSSNPGPAGAFVMGAILSFITGLHNYEHTRDTQILDPTFKAPARLPSVEELQLLQIGLGPVGTEVTRHAQHFNLKVWGMQDPASFHPYCRKVFPLEQAQARLPAADIVCLSASEQHVFPPCLGDQELSLTKKGAVIILLCGDHSISNYELEHLCKANNPRAILVDAHLKDRPSATSPVWTLPNLVLSPGVCTPVAPNKKTVMRSFHHNLRQFVHHNYCDMQGLQQTSLLRYPSS